MCLKVHVSMISNRHTHTAKGMLKEGPLFRNNREHARAWLLPRSPAEVGRWRYLEPITLCGSSTLLHRVIGSEGKQPSDGTPWVCSMKIYVVVVCPGVHVSSNLYRHVHTYSVPVHHSTCVVSLSTISQHPVCLSPCLPVSLLSQPCELSDCCVRIV